MPQTERNYTAIARRYARDVVSGKVDACQWVIKACQRQLDDEERAKNDKGWPYRFDAKKASRICAFTERLPHIKGEWAKRQERMILQPWQVFIYTTVFGWVNRETGLRRFRTVYIEVPRKNGKSSTSAPVGIFMLGADGEKGSEVYSAATTRDQAKIVWEVAKAMVEHEPGLRRAFGIETSAHSIYQTSTASSFKALSAEGNSLDGLNLHCGIVDELHAHRTRKVFDVLETAKGARNQPLLWNITTAGSDRSGICYEQRTYLTKILDGVAHDDTYWGVIYTIDDGDRWDDEKSWRMANPNYGISVSPDELKALCSKAQKMASAQNNFLTKHLDVWVNADVALFNATAWAKCKDESISPEQFAGDPCWIAIDLAPRRDFCSKVKVFKRDDEYFIFADHYLSEEEIEESGNSQFTGWAAKGWIKTNPGNVTDYAVLEDDLLQDTSDYQVEEVAFDPFSAHQFATRMGERGCPMVEMRATVQNFSEPTKKLDALISEGKIHHTGDPLLSWMLSNVVGHYDRKDNVYPVKERQENKIDGAIALIMALGRASLNEGPSESVYESRGLLELNA